MKKWVLFIGKTEVFFIALLWLIILLVAGTVAQKDIGLYAAQHKYFSSFFFSLKGLPLPAGFTIMAIIFVSLFVKLFTQKWHKNNAGTLVTHIGALMLLFGGFLTAISSSEGNMVIREGESAHYIEDYHHLELAVLDTENPKHDTVTVFPERMLKSKQLLKHASVPFEMGVVSFHKNAIIGMSDGEKIINELTPSTEDEENVSAINLYINGQNYVIGEFDTLPTRIGNRTIQLRHKRTYLPFYVELIDFEKQQYAGSPMAREYSSEVILHDGDIEWHSLIRMNEPLRYKGYTFYQSSFIEGDTAETTVLAVVKNLGRMFPYIASIIICIGLLIHLFQRIPSLLGRKK